MGTLLDLASLVTIPSGYKVGTVYSVVPTDGAGDLSFTRSNDTATRVGPNGLIEKVRTNLLTYSNDFSNASWSKITDGTYSLVTENITDAFGNTSAVYKVTLLTGSFLVFRKTLASSTTQSTTGSLYVKKTISSTFVAIDIDDNSDALAGANTNWQRITNTKSSATFIDITTYSVNEPYYIFASQMELGDIATDYIPTTTTAVSVGPVANLPRLDYLNSTCPNLLLEPQRTNYQLYSENSAQWLAPADGLTVAYNTSETIDPSGYYGAEKVTSDSGSKRMYEALSNPSGAFTMSAFVKKGTGDIFLMRTTSASVFVEFNLTTLAITSTSGTGTITNYGNGWYRVTASTSSASAAEVAQYQFPNDAGEYMYFWGAMVENGAYATSYVPTLGAASTRGADAVDKTGIGSLIGQTEGILFADVVTVAGSTDYNTFWQIYGDVNNRVAIGVEVNTTNIFGYINAGGTVQFFQTSTKAAGNHKIALAYKSGSIALYIDGALAFSNSNTFTFGTTLSRLFGNNVLGSETGIFKTNEMLLFPTRLSNAELAQLTTL